MTITADTAEFPFTRPEGSDADVFIQWKGTGLCMDLNCPCGQSSHVDAEFVYAVKCPACLTVYRMGTQVIVKATTEFDPSEVVWGEA